MYSPRSLYPSAFGVSVIIALSGCVDERTVTGPPADMPVVFAVGDVFTVTNTNDAGPGSLRQALADATSDATVQFDPSLAGATIALQSELTFAAPLTIEGPQSSGITLDGGGLVRVLRIGAGPAASSTVTLRNLTITGGKTNNGGGIASDADLLIEHSTIAANDATGGAGGGIFADAYVTLVNSTVSGNKAAIGGGVYANTILLVNGTVAYNEVASEGGGVWTPETLILRNSIVANNTGPVANCFVKPSLTSTLTLIGRNISTDATCGAAGPAMLIADPLLGGLASNGGPTQTHALLEGSPAIDAALSCNVTVDQRYVARPQGAACDIGAHEFDAYTKVTLVIDGSSSVNPTTGVAIVSGSIMCSDDESFDVQINLQQTQKTGRVTALVQAATTIAITCDTALQYWSAALAAASGAFRNGTASATVATANTQAWVTPVAISKPVKLFWGHR